MLYIYIYTRFYCCSTINVVIMYFIPFNVLQVLNNFVFEKKKKKGFGILL